MWTTFFALGLALTSPELKILGITSAWGDTALRSRMIDRLLCETGRSDIPVRTGIATKTNSIFTQKAWASQGIEREPWRCSLISCWSRSSSTQAR